MKVVALVPIKMNNERTPGKNTKQFDDGTPLIQFILKALLGAKKGETVSIEAPVGTLKYKILEIVK